MITCAMQGVEHVTHTYPDGTTRYFVNSVEQPQPQPRQPSQARTIDRSVPPAAGGHTTTSDHH